MILRCYMGSLPNDDFLILSSALTSSILLKKKKKNLKFSLLDTTMIHRASQVTLVVKNPPANAGDVRDVLDPWVRKIPRGRHGNRLQDSYLENPMDRRARWATVYRVAKSWTWLKKLHMPLDSWILFYSMYYNPLSLFCIYIFLNSNLHNFDQ